MKETKNKVSPGTKGTKQKATKPVKEKVKKETKKKGTAAISGGGALRVSGKRGAEEAALKTLMAETTKKISALAVDIVEAPTKKYIGWKLGSRRLVSIYPAKVFFRMWIFVYDNSGSCTGIERFDIKATSKGVGVVITGLISQVKKNYGILKAVAEKAAKKAEPKKKEAKKETFAEAKIVEEVPIKEALKEDKKKESASAKA